MLVIEGKKDADCKLLASVPGIEIITAMTYKAALDGEGLALPTSINKYMNY